MSRPDFSQLLTLFPGMPCGAARPGQLVAELFFDSRRVREGRQGLFLAFTTRTRDGHDFIPGLQKLGVSQWIISDPAWAKSLEETGGQNWILVPDVTAALHRIATWYRAQFSIPVVGITGSNGKTIVKEWLSQLLAPGLLICRSPGSFNSQIGLPVSVWNLEPVHQLGLFEAGISLPGEMEKLESILRPTLGILTKLGTAHREGFPSEEQKFREKTSLFRRCPGLVLPAALLEEHRRWLPAHLPLTTLLPWSWEKEGDSHVLLFGERRYPFHLPFADEASVENLGNALAAALALGADPADLSRRLSHLHGSRMRLSMKEGREGTLLVDDTYTNDLTGLEAALQFARLQCRHNQDLVLVCSDFEEDPHRSSAGEEKFLSLTSTFRVSAVYRIGRESRDTDGNFFPSVEAALGADIPSRHPGSVLLIKGSRRWGLERLVDAWQKKIHGTQLEINLDALVHNLNFYRSQVNPGTRIMAMVKALGYGAGEEEIVRTLVYHGVDYLAVAYADEGVKIRQAGIQTPILVMNPPEEAMDVLITWNLEPELYSFRIAASFARAQAARTDGASVPVHIKADTGMHRLGFLPGETDRLAQWLNEHPGIEVASIFSHLAGADEEAMDDYSQLQIRRFGEFCAAISEKTGRKFRRHILNSAGILRFPAARYDWVRLGIGLYGIEVNSWFQNHLEPVSRLKTTISQIKELSAGESVGYGRRTVLNRDSRIATLAIGYADGFRRSLSAGRGRVKIGGKWVPVVGSICMDMCMADVTDTVAEEGDEAIIFEDAESLLQIAEAAGTIPYEILTGIGHRVKRIFFRA